MRDKTHVKALEDLTFEDLYIEVPEQTYPELRAAIRAVLDRLHIKRVGACAVAACKRLFHMPASPHMWMS